MINPKDWKFVFGLIELLTREAYKRGIQDKTDGTKELDDKWFGVKGPSQLAIKKHYSEFMQKR